MGRGGAVRKGEPTGVGALELVGTDCGSRILRLHVEMSLGINKAVCMEDVHYWMGVS